MAIKTQGQDTLKKLKILSPGYSIMEKAINEQYSTILHPDDNFFNFFNVSVPMIKTGMYFTTKKSSQAYTVY